MAAGELYYQELVANIGENGPCLQTESIIFIHRE